TGSARRSSRSSAVPEPDAGDGSGDDAAAIGAAVAGGAAGSVVAIGGTAVASATARGDGGASGGLEGTARTSSTSESPPSGALSSNTRITPAAPRNSTMLRAGYAVGRTLIAVVGFVRS